MSVFSVTFPSAKQEKENPRRDVSLSNSNKNTPPKLAGIFVMEESGSDSVSGSVAARWRIKFSRSFQNYLDRSHVLRRWMVTLAAASIYILRVYYLQGFYVVSYGLATYILNLLIGFFSPKVDPELEALDGGASFSSPPPSPGRGSGDEFKPFIRRLPEFKFWYAATKAFLIAFVMTFFSVLDVPVFWPILLSYWLFLFLLTMKRQIVHMIKYKYVPFDIGKTRYGGDKPASSSPFSRG